MIKEIDLFGIYLPPMLAYMGAALLIWLVLRRGFALAGIYRFVWHPSLFNAALYIIILSGIIVAVFR